jgi:hypothetical protein
MQLIWQLVDGNREEFPEESINPDEKVNNSFSQLIETFLLSNFALRYEEYYYYYYFL